MSGVWGKRRVARLREQQAATGSYEEQFAAIGFALDNELLEAAASQDAQDDLIAQLRQDVDDLQAGEQPEPPDPTPPGMVLVWEDDFAGGSINTANWNARNDTQNNHQGKNSPSRAVVHDGQVDLTCVKLATPESGKPFGTAYIDTIGKPGGRQRYGYWEVECILPSTRGAWPAFWLRDNSRGGEIDIMEAVIKGGSRIGPAGGYLVFTVHQDTNGGGSKRGYEWKVPADFDWDAPHKFGVSWDGATMAFYVDRQVVTQVTTAQYSWLAGSFSADGLNIRFNYQAGGAMPEWYGITMDPNDPSLPDHFIGRKVSIYAKQ